MKRPKKVFENNFLNEKGMIFERILKCAIKPVSEGNTGEEHNLKDSEKRPFSWEKNFQTLSKTTSSAEETYQMGLQFGQTLTLPSVIAFNGNLGSGKTTFIRGIAAAFGIDEHDVCSPTFTYLNIYQGNVSLYHFDLYRIPNAREFIAAGFEEFLHAGGVCCIEWSEKIASLLPEKTLRVALASAGKDLRIISIQ
jgi:tRNA threonylcarbamoyladenosine biosynthesis protein TsaE